MEELIQILQKPLQQKEVEVADLPDLDLYMDQITTLFADKTQEPEGLLTKTMINNYSKDGLIKPIKGKKYSKEHVVVMIFIYYFKGILSISEIQTVLKPITDRFFAGNEGLKIETIYNEVFSLEREEVEVMKQDVVRKYHKAQETFFSSRPISVSATRILRFAVSIRILSDTMSVSFRIASSAETKGLCSTRFMP